MSSSQKKYHIHTDLGRIIWTNAIDTRLKVTSLRKNGQNWSTCHYLSVNFHHVIIRKKKERTFSVIHSRATELNVTSITTLVLNQMGKIKSEERRKTCHIEAFVFKSTHKVYLITTNSEITMTESDLKGKCGQSR